MNISIIVPAYNEEKNIIPTIESVISYLLHKFDGLWEVIVVDDGSSDTTYNLAKSYIARSSKISGSVKLLKNDSNMGKGAAVRKGMMSAQGDIRLFMDADNATKISEIDKFLPLFSEGADIVMGSRKIKGALIKEKQPFIRRLGSLAYHRVVKFFLGMNISDYNCGFKAFKGSVARTLFSLGAANGWEFDAELLFLAKKKGYSVREVPITWEHKDTSKVRAASAGMSSLKGILAIRHNDLKGLYGG